MVVVLASACCNCAAVTIIIDHALITTHAIQVQIVLAMHCLQFTVSQLALSRLRQWHCSLLNPYSGSLFYSESLLCLLYLHTYRFSFILVMAVFGSTEAAVSRPPGFNYRECREAFDNHHQWRYVCHSHPDLYPVLKFAEQIAKSECEKAFKNEKWNCSGFSILKAPKITQQGMSISILMLTYWARRLSILHWYKFDTQIHVSWNSSYIKKKCQEQV